VAWRVGRVLMWRGLRETPGGREGAAGHWLKRLFTKNTGPCHGASRRIGADACPVPECLGEWSGGARCGATSVGPCGAWLQLRTEAPVNGGRNYNGPKVAKFLVG